MHLSIIQTLNSRAIRRVYLRAMKIFKLIRKFFDKLAIYPSVDKYSLNWKNAVILSLIGQYVATTAAYFLFEAKTFAEYAESLYIVITLLNAFLMFVDMVRNATKIFELIGDFECTIEKSELIFKGF